MPMETTVTGFWYVAPVGSVAEGRPLALFNRPFFDASWCPAGFGQAELICGVEHHGEVARFSEAQVRPSLELLAPSTALRVVMTPRAIDTRTMLACQGLDNSFRYLFRQMVVCRESPTALPYFQTEIPAATFVLSDDDEDGPMEVTPAPWEFTCSGAGAQHAPVWAGWPW